MEQRHKILALKDYYEKYGTVITENGELNLKIADLRGLAWLAAAALHREYEFDDIDLIGAILFTENNLPTGILLNGVVWRAKQKRGL